MLQVALFRFTALADFCRTGGNSEEKDLALMADGKTVMIVMRVDGDCNCKVRASACGGRHGR